MCFRPRRRKEHGGGEVGGRGLCVQAEGSGPDHGWTSPTRVVTCFGRQRAVSVESKLEAVCVMAQEQWGAIEGF